MTIVAPSLQRETIFQGMALLKNGQLIFFDHVENGSGLEIFILCYENLKGPVQR